MSREAWGDEGNVPINWVDTAMRHEFDAARSRFDKWFLDFKDEIPSPELRDQISKLVVAFDETALLMEGDL